MDKQAAARAMDALLDAGSKLAVTIEDLRGGVPDDEFELHPRRGTDPGLDSARPDDRDHAPAPRSRS